MIDFAIAMLNTPLAQILRTAGYVAISLVFWMLFERGMHVGWRARYIYMSVALHMTLVSLWAALLVLGVNLGGNVFNAVISLTTGMMLVSTIYFFYSDDML